MFSFRRSSFRILRRALTVSVAFLSAILVAGQAPGPVRFLRFEEVQETLRLNADSGLPGSEIKESVAWDNWIRARDGEVRGRIDAGIEDSISNLILYGTSFASLTRVENTEHAASDSGELSAATLARVHALVIAVTSGAKNERVSVVRDFLARKGIAGSAVEAFFKE